MKTMRRSWTVALLAAMVVTGSLSANYREASAAVNMPAMSVTAEK